MTRLRLAPTSDTGLADPLDVLWTLAEMAKRVRDGGWTVNIAAETGATDRIIFSAQRPGVAQQAPPVSA